MGTGLDKELTFKEQESFGFLLIDTMSKQLEADLSITNENGISYTITWLSK